MSLSPAFQYDLDFPKAPFFPRQRDYRIVTQGTIFVVQYRTWIFPRWVTCSTYPFHGTRESALATQRLIAAGPPRWQVV